MIPTRNTHLREGLPEAEIKIYPGAAHGFLFQYPERIAADVSGFLSAR